MSQVEYEPCGCKAVLSEKDERASIWKAALGCLEFPLQTPIAHMGQGPGERTARFLKGDFQALDERQQFDLFHEMEKKFKVNIREFQVQVEVLGYIPIKDENITVVCCGLHSRMMMG